MAGNWMSKTKHKQSKNGLCMNGFWLAHTDCSYGE